MLVNGTRYSQREEDVSKEKRHVAPFSFAKSNPNDDQIQQGRFCPEERTDTGSDHHLGTMGKVVSWDGAEAKKRLLLSMAKR